MAKSSVDRWIDLVCNRWNINRIDSIGQFSRTVFQIEVLRIEYKRQISLLHQVSQLFEHWQTYCFRSNGSKNSNFLFDIEINWPNSTIVHDPIGVIWFHHQSLRAFKLMIQLQMYTTRRISKCQHVLVSIEQIGIIAWTNVATKFIQYFLVNNHQMNESCQQSEQRKQSNNIQSKWFCASVWYAWREQH